jgi:hypothetical protein
MPQESNEFDQLEQGGYTLLLYKEMSETNEGMVYFSLPGQDEYLYEYEGDLDQALDDLPEIYEGTSTKIQALNTEAIVVVEQLWDYFDRTEEQKLEGEHEYNFQVDSDRLLILPKDNSEEVVVINRDGNVESSFEPERFEHLMERFAIAYQQIQATNHALSNYHDLDRG